MSALFPTHEECGQHIIFGKIPIRTYAGEYIQMSIIDLPSHGIVDWHTHPQEQLGVIIRGKVVMSIGEETQEIGPGDFYWVPGGIPHRVLSIDGPAQFLDIFYPIREEYR